MQVIIIPAICNRRYDMNFNLLDSSENITLKSDSINSSVSPYTTKRSEFPEYTPIGMAYVPFQTWSDVYDADEAFKNGTLFPDLNLKFKRGAKNNE
jgi:hypothetical protein